MKNNIRITIPSTKDKVFLIATSTTCIDYKRNFYSSKSPIYYCLNDENVDGIKAADHYEILLDFSNKNIKSIIYKMFSRLLLSECTISVSVFNYGTIYSIDAEESMKMLGKLQKGNLISLKPCCPNDAIKSEIPLVCAVDNVISFIGSGNTGKTSIISSVSELFSKNTLNIALLDFTAQSKLSNYFPNSMDLSDILFNNKPFNPYKLQSELKDMRGPADLYVFKKPSAIELCETCSLLQIIKHLSETYDFVLINTDQKFISNHMGLLRYCSKIFVVSDLELEKVNYLHTTLANMKKSGINTNKSVSLVYNKIVRGAMEIGEFEESLIFESTSDNKLVPLVDIHCSTFEIMHSRRTEIALKNKALDQSDALSRTSSNYIQNINRLYRFINNMEVCEFGDMKVEEFFNQYVLRFNFKRLLSESKGFFMNVSGKRLHTAQYKARHS